MPLQKSMNRIDTADFVPIDDSQREYDRSIQVDDPLDSHRNTL
jgi:hypothetical protein